MGLLCFRLKPIDPDHNTEQGVVNIMEFVAAHSAGLGHEVCFSGEVLTSFPFNFNQFWVLRENLFRQVGLESREGRLRLAALGFKDGVP